MNTPQGSLQPSTYDILCGKDKMCVNHAGSKRFRVIIETYRERYAQALTKYDKMGITKEIYDGLSANFSRFLKFNDQLQIWEELMPMAARDKIGHSLRFANRKKRSGSKGSKSKSSISSSSVSVSSNSSCDDTDSSRSASPVPLLVQEEQSSAPMDTFDAQLCQIDQQSVGSDSVDSMVAEWMKLSDKDADLMALRNAAPTTLATSLLLECISASVTAPCRSSHPERISTQDQWSLLNDSILGEWNDIDTEISRSIFA